MLKTKVKKQATILGGRIGFMFLIASSLLICIIYFVLSKNFQNLLTDYTIKLVQAMVDQGVTIVESELNVSQREVVSMANSFYVPIDENETITFPKLSSHTDILRIVYVSKENSISSDGRKLDIQNRHDIIEAYNGKTTIYGPYFNEEDQYIICYSTPVFRDNEIVGVLSIEKDGYYFCELIKDIRFIDSGESYIINSDGTDIAVSNSEHIEWVNEQYNAKKLFKLTGDISTVSILELEQKGLNGESGIGTYYWENSLCYLVYAPILSVQWVLLAGLRKKEIDSITQSVIYNSIVKGPILAFSGLILILITVIVILCIISSMKKSAEINERLNIIANYDSLTGVMNRNSYHTRIDLLSNEKYCSLACIYIDANGLHEINNHLGHQTGDKMLKAVANELKNLFSQNNVYRIGGDEFVVFSTNQDKQFIYEQMNIVCQNLKNKGYEISIGIEWRNENLNVKMIINAAEEAMQKDKQRYYQENGKERQMRTLDEELEQMVLEKQDADTFLSVLAPEFKGVYFVDLGFDTIRHLYIPPYFEEMLKEADDIFSKALVIYNRRVVAPEYQQQFKKFCDYRYLETELKSNFILEFTYQKMDETWVKLRILKFKTYTIQCQETLWIFSNIDKQM